MRTSLTWFLRRPRSLRLCTVQQSLQTAFFYDVAILRCPNTTRSFQSRARHHGPITFIATGGSRPARISTPASFAEALQEEEMDKRGSNTVVDNISTMETDKDMFRPSLSNTKSADAWMEILDQFLPHDLKISTTKSKYTHPVGKGSALHVLQTLKAAQRKSNAGIDLLTYMGVRHGRWQAVVWLADLLLKRIGTDIATCSPAQMPSNVVWPPLRAFDFQPKEFETELTRLEYNSRENSTQWLEDDPDPRYSDSMSEEKDETMRQIWYSLGCIIIESKEITEESATRAMSVVYRILGKIHNADLVPDSVYSYIPPGHSSTIKRPPILHLLSSRMLSTLSDAVWRSHQEEVIAQASRSGATYDDIRNDPPGGRFRLKVRPLGPEVWLEFVLWCCADGGFAVTGARLIERMQLQTGEPWFAVDWTSAGNTAVDWDRVKLRHGGTVGQIEGYSSERPFAEMQPRTISTEVVLTLVESLINTVNVGLRDRGSSAPRAIKQIKSLISFLEPHSLPLQYFDYLAVRMAQTGVFDVERAPELFLSWTNTVAHFRSLENTIPKPLLHPSFDFESILFQSELQAGFLHQCLDGLVARGDIRTAIDVFSAVQQFVDNSKLESIGSFLNAAIGDEEGIKSSRSKPSDLEYVRSHGQLTPYKMAGFFNLVIDSKLVRLGQWLLYSEDVDGPPIPISVYGSSCFSTSLVRFATLSHDTELIRRLVDSRKGFKLKPAVNFLRSLANAHIALLDFEAADSVLRDTIPAKAGGIGVSNMAQLVAVILRLESDYVGFERQTALQLLSTANSMVQDILSGRYDGNRGDFSMEQRATFRRQIACILRVVGNISDTSIGFLAEEWKDQYTAGNDIGLSTSAFNTILEAVVETRGAKEGRKLWGLFCQDPRIKYDPSMSNSLEDIFSTQNVDVEGEGWESVYIFRRESHKPTTIGLYMPLVNFDKPEIAAPSEDAAPDPEAPHLLPPRAQGIDFDLPLGGSGYSKNGVSFREPTNQATSVNTTFTPLVIPDLRTLRHIVRSAIAERRILRDRCLDTSEQDSILKWAGQFFEAFGISTRLIEQELQQAYVSEGLSPAEAMAAYNTERSWLRLKDVSTADAIKKAFTSGNEATRLPMRPVRYFPKGIPNSDDSWNADQ